MGVNAARATNNDNTKLYFNTIKASALVNGQHSDTAQAIHAGWAYDHNVSSRLFVGIFNDYDYDKFQNLNLRLTAGGVFGYHVHKSVRSQLDVLGGLDYNRASYFAPNNTTSFAEVTFGDDYSLKINGNTSLTQSMRFFDSLKDSSAYRANFDLGASTKDCQVADVECHSQRPLRRHPKPRPQNQRSVVLDRARRHLFAVTPGSPGH